MNHLLHWIAQYGITIIFVMGVGIAVLLLVNGMSLANKKSRLKEALERKNKQYSINKGRKELEERDDEKASITPDTIRKYETDFNKACAWHSVLVQFIPVFPLLGILGTVAGLMLELQSSDIAGMMSSLGVAMGTTFWGLIFSIVLKSIEAVFPSRIIYDVEVMLDDFDKKINIAEMFQNLQNKQDE